MDISAYAIRQRIFDILWWAGRQIRALEGYLDLSVYAIRKSIFGTLWWADRRRRALEGYLDLSVCAISQSIFGMLGLVDTQRGTLKVKISPIEQPNIPFSHNFPVLRLASSSSIFLTYVPVEASREKDTENSRKPAFRK